MQRVGYVGHDVHTQVPPSLRPVALVMEDTDRYPLLDDAAWASILAPQRGFIRLGPSGTPFGVSAYHQLHCINGLRFSYLAARDGLTTTPEERKSAMGHGHHCFNLLRQSILCKADLTLIPAGKHNSSEVPESAPTTHRCRDWAQLRRFVIDNQEEWKNVPLLPDSEMER